MTRFFHISASLGAMVLGGAMLALIVTTITHAFYETTPATPWGWLWLLAVIPEFWVLALFYYLGVDLWKKAVGKQ